MTFVSRLRFVAALGLVTSTATAQPSPETERNLGDDFVGTLHQLGAGAAAQVTHWDSVALLAGGAAVSTALLLTERSWQEDIEQVEFLGPTALEVADIGGVVTTMPSIGTGAYIWGRVAGDEYLTQFATELTATQGIVLLETLLLSQIPVHERPVVDRGEVSDDDQPFFNRFFRGQSSFPSGHITGLSVLTFKGWEWYGWKLGVPAALATLFVGYARVEEGQHFTSDIFSGIALSGLAALGTSRARFVWRRYLPEQVLVSPVALPSGAGVFLSGKF